MTPIVWGNPENPYAVPLWIIILAILAGLLLLALLIYILYKVRAGQPSLCVGAKLYSEKCFVVVFLILISFCRVGTQWFIVTNMNINVSKQESWFKTVPQLL